MLPAHAHRVAKFTQAKSLRDDIAARCVDDSLLRPWRLGVASAAAGMIGTDAILCRLACSASYGLRRLVAYAEAVRVQLRTVRELERIKRALRNCDQEAHMTTADSVKVATLELELFSVDAVLRRWRAERSAVTEDADSLSDAELVAQHAELTARLDAADARLCALPTTLVDPPCASAGLVVLDEPAPPALPAEACIALDGALNNYTSPGCTQLLRLPVVLQSTRWRASESESAEELKESLDAFATHEAVSAATVDEFLSRKTALDGHGGDNTTRVSS